MQNTPGISVNSLRGLLQITPGIPANNPRDSANYPRDSANYPRDSLGRPIILSIRALVEYGEFCMYVCMYIYIHICTQSVYIYICMLMERNGNIWPLSTGGLTFPDNTFPDKIAPNSPKLTSNRPKIYSESIPDRPQTDHESTPNRLQMDPVLTDKLSGKCCHERYTHLCTLGHFHFLEQRIDNTSRNHAKTRV